MAVEPQPREEFLTPTTEELLEVLPPFLRRATDIQGTFDALARELDRLEARRIEVIDNFFPQSAGEWLTIYERILGLPVDPPEKTLAQRRASVLAFFGRRGRAGSGLTWQERLSSLLGLGWSYEEHVNGDAGTPPANTIRIVLPYSAELTAPTGFAAAADAAPGTLNDTYRYVMTTRNYYGETTPTAYQEVTTTVLNPSALLTWGPILGATSYSIYRKEASASAYEFLTSVDSAESDFLDDGSIAQIPGVAPPSVNTTESFQSYEAKRLAREVTDAHLDIEFGYTEGFLIGISAIGDVL